MTNKLEFIALRFLDFFMTPVADLHYKEELADGIGLFFVMGFLLVVLAVML